ncbi:unnamed protein product [Periconia digitata]|uniref:BHLH domain-containing protein n=1 Tax=Periconia digitata TaxID=1303443 RepID=A0A9W4UQ51_9PLEO|nr:unnamed protein product [Periconia digitata]
MPGSPPSPSDQPDRTRLSEAQKKENHIKSEQKRREAIRGGFDRLADIVPGMAGQGRSEAVVLEATLQMMREQIDKRQKLIEKAKAKGLDVSSFELDQQTVMAAYEQMERNARDARDVEQGQADAVQQA